MAQIIDFAFVKKGGPNEVEYCVSPQTLATILPRIMRNDPKGYKNIVKAISIYGEIPIEHLMKMSKEAGQ